MTIVRCGKVIEGFIKINSRPTGGAPAEIRDEWIGLTLPFNSKSENASLANVLTYAREPEPKDGYAVDWVSAMEILGKESPTARHWWETNVKNCSFLTFSNECCVEVPEPEMDA